MVKKFSPSIKAGISGAVILFIVAVTFGYFWFMFPRDQISILSGLYGPGYLLSFVVAGILAVHFSQKKPDNAGMALSSGLISGCVTAVILVIAWALMSVTILIHLDYNTWIGLTLAMTIPIMAGVAISAISSVIYAYIDRSFTAVKE